jgi:hypothetical protein
VQEIWAGVGRFEAFIKTGALIRIRPDGSLLSARHRDFHFLQLGKDGFATLVNQATFIRQGKLPGRSAKQLCSKNAAQAQKLDG